VSVRYVVLEFTAPFHVGVGGLGDTYRYVPSFTIYGALEALRHMGVNHGVEKVSSAYPLVKHGGDPKPSVPTPAFLPRLLLRKIPQGVSPPKAIKKLKKLRYIPLDCLSRLDSFEVVIKGKDDVDILCDGKSIEAPESRLVVVERNVLSRHLNNADVYRVVAVMPTTRYVVYYEGGDKRAFELLGKIGLGGERSSGLGKFVVVGEGSERIDSSGNRALLLGVGRVREPRGDLQVEYLAWNCSHGLVGPTSVLTDGTVLEGNLLEFEDIVTENCVVKLSPLYLLI